MPPQEGKTTRVVRDFVIRALERNPDTRVVAGAYNQSLANRNGLMIRRAISSVPQLGLAISRDNGSKHEWELEGHRGGVLSVGRGAGVDGRPADMIVIDDPVSRTEADSELARDDCWDWWTESLSARLAPGAPVVVIMTRWHEDDLIGRLVERDTHAGWRIVNIPAQCEDPATDPLGRQAGEYMISARRNRDGTPRTREQWESRKRTVGSRVWSAMYQGHPSPAEGGLLKRDWWKRYFTPLWTTRDDGSCWAIGFDELLISADLAFKGTTTSDYVAIGVWGRRVNDAYLLDQVREQLDFVGTLHHLVALCAKWPQATLKLVEDKANGPALISMLAKRIVGIVPINPTAGKVQRAEAWAPLAESGHVWLPSDEIAPWVGDYIEELAGFPNAAHDDQVDQTSMALDRMILRPLLDEGREIDATDDYDDYRIGY
nr:phage terminase large subunit [Brooklawnia cerclae]